MTRELARGAWRAWSGRRAATLSGALVVAALLLLFLHAAATVEVTYTIRVSYALLIAACAVGLAYVLRGIRCAPASVRWLGGALVAVYAVAWLAGVDDVVGDQRGGTARGLVYMSDLVLGLAVAALLAGLSSTGNLLRPALKAVFAGAVLAALYALYEWAAPQLGLRFVSVNNALNTDGVTRGGQLQGYGVFGSPRVRSTFVEPHFLAAYLATLVPLAFGLAGRGVRRGLAWGAAGVVLAALVFTSSAPAWAALVLGLAAAGCAWAVSLGRPLQAAALAAVLVTVTFAGPLLLVDPEPVAAVTGRSTAQVDLTARFRTDNWRDAIEIWGTRPAFGLGPGQSAVQLSPNRTATDEESAGRTVLGSAQGLWAAALVDGGVVGFGVWALFLAALLAAGWRLVMRDPTPIAVALVAALATGVAAAQVSGDRLELRVWALAGLVLGAAAASRHAGGDARQRHEQARRETEQRPADGRVPLLADHPGE